MKKLISLLIALNLLIAVAGCARGQQTVTHRGELSVAYDRESTKELLTYFQANQDCIVTGVLLDAETDYETLPAKASVALLKDEAVAEQLKAAGWTETENWTDAQKKTNEGMFSFIVLTAPDRTDSAKKAEKLLTDWLVGDGAYEKTITTASGGCSCKRTQTTVTYTSDAPELFKSGQFSD